MCNKYAEISLIYACQNNMEEYAIKLLDTYNIDCNYVDQNKFSILMHACENNMEDVALKLMENYYFDYSHKDDLGNTAYTIAEKNNMYKVMRRIEKEEFNGRLLTIFLLLILFIFLFAYNI